MPPAIKSLFEPAVQYLDSAPRPYAYLLLLVPLVIVVSYVYKATKAETGAEILLEGTRLTASIFAVMAAMAAGLYLLVQFTA